MIRFNVVEKAFQTKPMEASKYGLCKVGRCDGSWSDT